MKLIKKIVFIFANITILIGCKKDTITAIWEQQNSNTNLNLCSAFFFTPDTGYICGGLQYTDAIILKTENAGFTWQPITLNPSFNNKIIFDIFFLHPNKGFAAAYDCRILTNNNNNWQLTQANINNHAWQGLRAINFANDTLGFIAGGLAYNQGSIFKTTNGGNNWTYQYFPTELRDIYFTSYLTGYACGYGIVYKTTDSGTTWNPLNIDGDFFMGIHFPNKDVGYVVGNQGTIAKTTNEGLTWEKLRNGNALLKKKQHFEDVFFENEEKGYIVGQNIFWVTQNAGQTWNQVDGIDFENFNAIYITKPGQGFVVGNNGTIVKFHNL